jgi:hypothetical protein
MTTLGSGFGSGIGSGVGSGGEMTTGGAGSRMSRSTTSLRFTVTWAGQRVAQAVPPPWRAIDTTNAAIMGQDFVVRGIVSLTRALPGSRRPARRSRYVGRSARARLRGTVTEIVLGDGGPVGNSPIAALRIRVSASVGRQTRFIARTVAQFFVFVLQAHASWVDAKLKPPENKSEH